MHHSEFLDESPTAAEQGEPEQPAPEKRNCGRTGPTSPEGRATSSKNSTKHGSCSQTLILPHEKEECWLLLLNRWLQTYQPAEDSLLYDFVLKTAQAEWYRMRAQINVDCHECSQPGLSPTRWTPNYIKKHDLFLRYKTTAERGFQRTFRLLEQFCKSHPNESRPAEPAPAKPAESEPVGKKSPNPNSSSSAKIPPVPPAPSILHEVINGVANTTVRPYYPRKNPGP